MRRKSVLVLAVVVGVLAGSPAPAEVRYNITDVGTMDAGTTYYWQVDEVGLGGTITGEVWSFTAAAPASLRNRPVLRSASSALT